MNWKQIPLGAYQTNCYILYNADKQCIIFDPGSEGDALNTFISQEEYKPLAIVLTHAHFDHIGAVDIVRDKWNIPVYIHELEKDWLANPSLNGSGRFPVGDLIKARDADKLLSNEKDLQIGPFSFKLLHTPGHSPGSLSFYVNDMNIVFAGDTLFSGSIGRTDLTEGSHEQLILSIKNKLLTLPEATAVLPGHGPATTVERERSSNPFL
ncbi:MBL fold metallo-hydrolase [Lederbergia lenta]|uniref:Beta-lactamase domain-containing protein n=1 Tax=Lederbergia lenta TaxID=1467 RepID=A0A2X4YW86_LEDLE|nr:MBL fold metallo-hydrolase [Lederbergia lenta]MCM3111439.1 MBL fold metallo-hydrolase [Lederbergia lenta]MEC2325175.1 MBL fold metallo-hydrolase [Lederbergia lenta]SQI56075.1 beta-lactamase domain-containing protein [Lederbergia lenta]